MSPVLDDRTRRSSRLVSIGWFALPVVVGGYIILRYAIDTQTALIASQVLYLGPVVGAIMAFAVASRRARMRSRARRMWTVFAAAMTAACVAEAGLAARVMGLLDEARAGRLFDIGSTLAIALLLAGGLAALAIDRIGWRRSLRRAFDGVAVTALAFAVLYAVLGERYLLEVGDPVAALRVTAYAFTGFLFLEISVLVFSDTYSLRAPWNRVLAVGMGTMAVAAVMWATLVMARWVVNEVLASALAGTLYLVGYYILMMAGVQRVAHTDGPVRAVPSPPRPRRAWPGVALSALVVGSVVWLIALSMTAPADGLSRVVYTVALTGASIAMVARTVLAAAEASELTALSLSDPLTGALGPRSLEQAWGAVTSEATRRSMQVAAYSIDMDDFARVNAVQGFRAGDRHLRAVARVLEREAGPSGWVLRLSGDEFTVLVVVKDAAMAGQLAERLRAGVRDAGRDPGLSASVGSALYPHDAGGLDGLIRRAAAARVWAKRQGKDCCAAYDAQVEDAVSLDERLARARETGRDMARALVAAADARDPASHDHARNVAALSRLFADSLGLERQHVQSVEIAALLHDVGKIALPNVMLGGKTLSAKEQIIAREHCLLGERLVEFMSSEGVPGWIRSHHERWDGAGYPDGLAGEDIPLESRIIALADAYDGMTAGRRYGAPMSKAAALQEIDLGIGARFDPVLSEAFITMVGTTRALGWHDQAELS